MTASPRRPPSPPCPPSNSPGSTGPARCRPSRSPRDALARAERFEPAVNAFVSRDEATTLAEA